MGSKKPKRKKITYKNISKFHKTKKMKENKTFNLKSLKEHSEKRLLQKNEDSYKRLFNYNCSRFIIDNNKATKLKNFVQMREHYFGYLRTVVNENCIFFQSTPNVDVLEKLSLEIEQQALLASLQTDLYIETISTIINEIDKCNKLKEIHSDIRKLLSESQANMNNIQVKYEKCNLDSQNIGKVSEKLMIPEHQKTCIANKNMSVENLDTTSDIDNSCTENNEKSKKNCVNSFSNNLINNQITCLTVNSINCTGSEKHELQKNMSNDQIVTPYHFPLQSSSTLKNSNMNDCSVEISELKEISSKTSSNNRIDPVLASLNQLQKSANLTLNNSEKDIKEKNEEKERAYIAKILEEDSSNDKFDSFSDNDNDLNESINEANLVDRLEKMREIFGLEGDQNFKEKPVLSSINVNKTKCRDRKFNIWRHEKIIQQFGFAMISSELSFASKIRNNKLLLELFGEDSDNEHETEYRLYERYRASCRERISSWVVKYLMPFYNDRRIIGRSTFKSLGYHISNKIVDQVQHPDEGTVKYLVSKFFPPKKRYMCDADILEFKKL